MSSKHVRRRHILTYFVAPFVFLTSFYWALGTVLNVLVFKQPAMRIESMALYLLSWSIDTAGLDLNIYWEVPGELALFVSDFYPEFNHPFPVSSWHYFFTLGGHSAYEFLPYFIPISLVLSLCFYFQNPLNGEKLKPDKVLRGTVKLSAKEFIKLTNKTSDVGLVLPTNAGNMVLNRTNEKAHFFILGTTGCGKSSLLKSMVYRWIKQREGCRLIIVDRKGEFYQHFGRKQDILFNPFDGRSVKWSLMNEIEFERDRNGEITRIPISLTIAADTLFGVSDPNLKGNDKFWKDNASLCFQSGICWLALHGRTRMRDIVDFFHQTAPDLMKRFMELPEPMRVGVAAFGGDPANEQAGGIISTITAGIKQLGTCASEDGTFSVRQWINSADDSNLFLSTAGRYDMAFVDVLSLWISLITQEIKAFPDDSRAPTKFVFLIDELGAMSPGIADTLHYLVSQARSKGVCTVLASQSFSKIKELFRDNGAKNLLLCCNTRFFFRIPEADDAVYISKTIGSREVLRTNESQNESSGTLLSIGQARRGSSESMQITKDEAFLPADIAALNIGEAIVQLPEMDGRVSKIKFKHEQFRSINKPYDQIEHETVMARAVALPVEDLEAEQHDEEPPQELEKKKARIRRI